MKLYVYDHCPYCVKARAIFGLKNVPVELIAIANDDEETPISMIGQKMVPILQKEDGTYMPESMDIVRFINENYGEKLIKAEILNKIQNPALAAWEEKIKPHIYKLAMPRWVDAGLEEFRSQSAKDYFTNKKEAYLGTTFRELFKQSSEMIKAVNPLLEELSAQILMPSGRSVVDGKTVFINGEISEDDIHLFAHLRSLSIVEGVVFPDKVKKYAANFSTISKIPLHFGIAL